MREIIEAICRGHHLDTEGSRALFARILGGQLGELELAGLLVALKAKGETPDEVAGAAQAMRGSAVPFPTAGLEVVDTCGTGGEGAHTVNISTAVAVLAAELGLRVAKHGNRSVSSKCGSADVLEQCGVKIDASPEASRRCLEELGLCFLYAPSYHPGVRFAMPVRRALGVRTIFNVLGPLANPALPAFQIVGVYDPALCAPMARTLGLLGARRALVVHGSGIDEIGLHGPTTAALLDDGEVRALEIDPAAVGLGPCRLEELRGGGPEENAAWLEQLLGGGGSRCHQEVIAVNTGALLWIAGRSPSLGEGTRESLDALRSGRCRARLHAFAELSHAA